jgi:hypothetical protein
MGQAFSEPVEDVELNGIEPWPDEPEFSVRWAVCIRDWKPKSLEWRFLCSLLPQAEVVSVEKVR